MTDTDHDAYYLGVLRHGLTKESSWTHPSDSVIKQMVTIVQTGTDIRGQLKAMYQTVLQQAEGLSSQWQGPYQDTGSGRSYYHYLPTNKTSWDDPLENVNYLATICVKLMENFGSRSDVAEASSGFAQRKEVLRQHRSMIEQQIGPLRTDEYAYVFGQQQPGGQQQQQHPAQQQHPGYGHPQPGAPGGYPNQHAAYGHNNLQQHPGYGHNPQQPAYGHQQPGYPQQGYPQGPPGGGYPHHQQHHPGGGQYPGAQHNPHHPGYHPSHPSTYDHKGKRHIRPCRDF